MKEDDMDEMLRKAAANYEVDAGKAADWNAVFKAVHLTEEEFVPVVEEKRKRRRFVFWWLLLIPLGWMANSMYNKFNEPGKNENKTQVQVESKLSQEGKPTDEALSNQKAVENNSAGTGNEITDNKSLPGNIVRSNSTYTLRNVHPDDNKLTDKNLRLQLQQPINGSTYQALQNQQTTTSQTQQVLPKESKNADVLVKGSNVDSPVVQQKDISSTLNADTVAKQNSIASASKTSIKIPRSNNHFYAGLMAGMDLSFVKYQQMEPLGYNAGLLVGYKFRKLSVESGLYFVKKNYYTEGEYFDKSGIPYFNDAEILTVDGYCQMFEIPVNVKYDFVQKKNHSWFVTAGLSSYLMNKEYYNYDYMKDGEEHYGSRAYYHATQNWFSVLNVSAGYQLKTSTKTNLRIEPYFKAPISGVGTGKLSISSVGVNAGIVRQIP